MYNPNQFDPRFSIAEKEAMAVVIYDDLISEHDLRLRRDLAFSDIVTEYWERNA